MKDWRWIIILVLSLLLALLPRGDASAQAPPSVTTEPATDVTCTSATLNGNLTSMGDASEVYVSFEWGDSPSLGNETPQELMSSPGPFHFTLSDLSGNTTYYFRAKADGNGTAYGGNLTFTTLTAPTVTTNEATSITDNSAVLNGNLDSLGNATEINVSFQWGLTTNYSNETTPEPLTAPGAFSAPITDLSPRTTYHFRAKATDGNCTSYGLDQTFTTAEHLSLSGWGWCTNYEQIVPATLEGYVTVIERAHAPQSFSVRAVGNITLQLPDNSEETILFDMYGSKVRSLFYLRQEVTGESGTFTGTWIRQDDNTPFYMVTTGLIAIPNPEGSSFKTARLCFVLLRTPDVVVPLGEPDGFVADLDYIIGWCTALTDRFISAFVGTGVGKILSEILAKLMVIIAGVRELGITYFP